MKRRGFTLIELMVVIAIIIILAAIAIPNYLTMTVRAKRSRLAADFATMATVLETYKTDWGIYPKANAAVPLNGSSVVRAELSQGGGTAVTNKAGAYNAVSEEGPINYIKDGTLTSMANPFVSGNAIQYKSTTAGTAGWLLSADVELGTGQKYLFRTSASSTVSAADTLPPVPTN